MIKSVTVTNFLGERFKMVLTDPYESGMYIKSIDGLGPTKANINISDVSGVDGGEYNSARAETKNVVLSLGFLEKPDIETMRHLSYRYFPLKKKLTLTIETDYRIASIDGYVESNEPDIFAEQEGCQVSVLCPKPYFYTDDIVTVFTGVAQLFEFPFENNSLTTNEIVLSEIRDDIFKEIYYYGDVDTGIRAEIRFFGEATNIGIVNATTRERMTIDTNAIATITGAAPTAGDEIILSTIKGDRYITLYRGGVFYNILNAVARGSAWPQLYRGSNVFTYTADSGMPNLEFRIFNNVLYEGI